MPEEIRGSSFLRMTMWGNPPDDTSAPWLRQCLPPGDQAPRKIEDCPKTGQKRKQRQGPVSFSSQQRGESAAESAHRRRGDSEERLADGPPAVVSRAGAGASGGAKAVAAAAARAVSRRARGKAAPAAASPSAAPAADRGEDGELPAVMPA